MTESNLFSPIKINDTVIKNRFVRSATHEGLCPNGFYSDELNKLLTTLADNEVGLIITGHAYVHKDGIASPFQAAADSDKCIAQWQKTVQAVHRNQSRIFLQISHGGIYSLDPQTACGPSAWCGNNKNIPCQVMSIEAIKDTVNAFALAAQRAQKANFDGVQIHVAHGYLLSEFLSGFYNQRQDEYGGSLANRSRFLIEVYQSIRAKVGEKFPIIIKINSEDFLENGLTVDECAAVCAKLQSLGLDGVELSGGTQISPPEYSPIRRSNMQSSEQQLYYENAAAVIKKQLHIPLIVVGGGKYIESAQRLLDKGEANMIAFSRALIREPYLIKRWKNHELNRAKCTSCNGCFRPILVGRGCFCALDGKKK